MTWGFNLVQMMAPGYMGHNPEIPNFDIGSIGKC